MEAERDEARRQLEEERRLHAAARHQAAVAIRLEQQHQSHSDQHDHTPSQHTHCEHDHEHSGEKKKSFVLFFCFVIGFSFAVGGEKKSLFFLPLFPSEGGVPVEIHQALQAAMEKLQHRFTSLMQEKADLKERVEELEHRCIQLSGETDTIGETGILLSTNRDETSNLGR